MRAIQFYAPRVEWRTHTCASENFTFGRWSEYMDFFIRIGRNKYLTIEIHLPWIRLVDFYETQGQLWDAQEYVSYLEDAIEHQYDDKESSDEV